VRAVVDVFSFLSPRYVGNTMASFVMQSLGCEVSAINTVNFSTESLFPLLRALEQVLSACLVWFAKVVATTKKMVVVMTIESTI
jgi:hypothetical protein